jgi:hypothetical protein
MGSYWSCRPNTFLFDFERQAQTARENEDAFADDFGWILARVAAHGQGQGRSFLSPSVRAFEDFAVYANLAGTLWVWSKLGIAAEQEHNVASAHTGYRQFALRHQVIAEESEFGLMVRRRALDTALHHDSQDAVLSVQRELITLERSRTESSHYGEIRDMLTAFETTRDVDQLRQRTEAALGVANAEAALREQRRNERLARSLEIVIGVLAVPPLASDILGPLWRSAGLPRPATDDIFQLLLVGVAVMLYIFLLYALAAFVSRSPPHDPDRKR